MSTRTLPRSLRTLARPNKSRKPVGRKAARRKLPRKFPGLDSSGYQELWRLKGLDPHVSTSGVNLNPMTLAQLNRKGLVAARLEILADMGLEIAYHPNTSYSDDPESGGHLFCGNLPVANQDDGLWIDDRLPDLAGQLIKELERVSQIYLDLASTIRANGVAVIAKARKAGAA